jgi:hypothetical protein
MKPFNLQEALAGKPVVARDGRDVLQLEYFSGVIGFNPVVALLAGDYDVKLYTKGGKYDDSESKHDLFMRSTKKQAFINIYPQGGVEGSLSRGLVYESKVEADAQASSKRLAVAVAEWEQ